MTKLLAITFFALVSTMIACAHRPLSSERYPSQSAALPVSSNSGVTSIEDASVFSKVFVVSDVHGMFLQLVNNLKAAQVIDAQNNWIAGNSLLIITGDSIDKGPQSLEVLDLWIRLQEQAKKAQGQLIHTLGNHEAELLNGSTDKASELIAELKQRNTPLTDITGTSSPRGQFIHQEVLALEVGRWLFCHSGFYPSMAWLQFSQKAKSLLQQANYSDDFILGSNSVLEAKKWESNANEVIKNLDQAGFYGVVFGHQPKAFNIVGRSAALQNGHLIKIDNGMPPEGGSYPGSVLVFQKPSQMNQLSFPQIDIISASGSKTALVPE